MPNKRIKDGELLFFDRYYGVAVLEISVDKPLRCPSFVSSPEYGDKVFVLARDEDSSLLTTSGRIMCHNEAYLNRNYYLYVNCVLPEVLIKLLVFKCCILLYYFIINYLYMFDAGCHIWISH